jgi:hypothetical protein
MMRRDRSRPPVGAERQLNHWPLITVAITDDGQATVTSPAGNERVREPSLPATRDAVTQLVASYAREHLGRPVAVQITEPTGVFGLWVDVDATKSPRTSTDAARRGAGRQVARRPPPQSARHVNPDHGVAPTMPAAQSRTAGPEPHTAAVPPRPHDRGRRGSLLAGGGVLALALVIAAVVMLITANHGPSRHPVQAPVTTARRSGSTATVPAPKTGRMAADVHDHPRSEQQPRPQVARRPRAHLSRKPRARHRHARRQHPHHARPARSTDSATAPTVTTAPVTPTPTATVAASTPAPAPVYTAPTPTPTPTPTPAPVPTSSPAPEPSGGSSAAAGPTGPGEQSGGCDPICQ